MQNTRIGDWFADRYGANLVIFRNEKQGHCVVLEYHPEADDFSPRSGYRITSRFTMHNRQYDAEKPGNLIRFSKLMKSLQISGIMEKAKADIFT